MSRKALTSAPNEDLFAERDVINNGRFAPVMQGEIVGEVAQLCVL
jgi:hypothetical protein